MLLYHSGIYNAGEKHLSWHVQRMSLHVLVSTMFIWVCGCLFFKVSEDFLLHLCRWGWGSGRRNITIDTHFPFMFLKNNLRSIKTVL